MTSTTSSAGAPKPGNLDDVEYQGVRERVAARFGDYLANRAHLYALERRWADRPFWRERA